MFGPSGANNHLVTTFSQAAFLSQAGSRIRAYADFNCSDWSHMIEKPEPEGTEESLAAQESQPSPADVETAPSSPTSPSAPGTVTEPIPMATGLAGLAAAESAWQGGQTLPPEPNAPQRNPGYQAPQGQGPYPQGQQWGPPAPGFGQSPYGQYPQPGHHYPGPFAGRHYPYGRPVQRRQGPLMIAKWMTVLSFAGIALMHVVGTLIAIVSWSYSYGGGYGMMRGDGFSGIGIGMFLGAIAFTTLAIGSWIGYDAIDDALRNKDDRRR